MKVRKAAVTPGERIDKLALLGLYTRCFELAKSYHATLDEVMSTTREHRVKLARHAIWAYLRGLTRAGRPVLSYPNIGDLFGVHNSTVIHGVRAHHERKQIDEAA